MLCADSKKSQNNSLTDFIVGDFLLFFLIYISVGKESACNSGDTKHVGLISGSERSSRDGHGNPPQYSCLKNPLNRGAWQAIVYRVSKS